MGAEVTYTETAAQAHILNSLNDKSDQLMAAARALSSDMDRLVQTITAGYSVNGLGEIQSRGSRLDILCGERQLLAETAKVVGCETDHINEASMGHTGSARTWFMSNEHNRDES